MHDAITPQPRFREWIEANNIRVLNVAGSRESQCPGIYRAVVELLRGANREVVVADIPRRVIQRLETFGNSLLRTMDLALDRKHKASIEAALGDQRDQWHFEDRVLIWLAPNLRENAANYYESHGPTLSELLELDELERLDVTCRQNLIV